MTTPEWATRKIDRWGEDNRFIALLGSFPTHGKQTPGEEQRSDYLARAAQQLGLMIHEDFRSDGRRYVFVERHFLIHVSHSADISGLVFGDLTVADSDGFVCPLPAIDLGCHNESLVHLSDWQSPCTTDEEYVRRGLHATNYTKYWRYVWKGSNQAPQPCCVEVAKLAKRIAAEQKEVAA